MLLNIVYHVENQDLVRYAGDYDNFQSVYAMKKAQLEAAYERQQKEIADLQDFVNRNKARVATRNMACLARKNWIRWKSSSCKQKNQNLNSISRKAVRLDVLYSKLRIS